MRTDTRADSESVDYLLHYDENALINGVILGREAINQAWTYHARRHMHTPSDTISYDIQADGSLWRVGSMTLGTPQLTYDDIHVTARIPLISESQLSFKRELGERHRSLSEWLLQPPPSEATYTVKCRLVDAYLRYRSEARSQVGLCWTGTATFENSGGNHYWAALDAFFRRERRIGLYDLQAPRTSWLKDVVARVAAQPSALDFMVYQGSGSRQHQVAAPVASLPMASDPTVGIVTFSGLLFPEVLRGEVPYDRQWLVDFWMPPATMRFTSGVVLAPSTGYWAQYDFNQHVADARAIAASTVGPRLRVVNAGDGNQTLTLIPANPAAQWSFDGPALGRLIVEGGTRYYQPPERPTPALVLEPANKTDRPAVRAGALHDPVTVDQVVATVSAQSSYGTFVTWHAPSTHFFRAEVVDGALRLTLCYTRFGGGDVEVPAAQTRWKVIAGNASVSAAGVFTPASQAPSPFTVIVATDTEGASEFHYWAAMVIPVPLLDVARFVELMKG